MSSQFRITLVTIGLTLMSSAYVPRGKAQQKVLTNDQVKS